MWRDGNKGIFIAWGLAVVAFAATTAVILFAPMSYLAVARVEINPLDVSPTGMGGFVRVDFAYGNRMLPQEMVARIISSGSLRRALQKLKWPDDEAGMDRAAYAVLAHLVPGTTVVEVMARTDKPEDGLALVEAVIAVQDEMRREERGGLARRLLAVLDEASAGLSKERQALAKKLSGMDVHMPVDYSTFALRMDNLLAANSGQRAKLAESLRRVEDLESQAASGASAGAGEEFFATNAGYAALRARLTSRQSVLARLTATQGANSDEFKQTFSEVQTLEAGLRQYVSGAAAQLRSQIEALDESNAEIEKRMKTREEAMAAVQSTLLSPEYESLRLRSDTIREQLTQIEQRRAEVQTYMQLYQPALRVVVPPEVGSAPEDRFRGARVVFAAFGALFIGISLSTILRHRCMPPPGPAFD